MRVGNNDDNFAEGLSKLDTAGKSGNTFYLDRLYYRFPVGEEFTAVVGPMARNTEALGMKPTAYTVKTLNMFGGQFGTGNVYNKGTGSFVGGIWKQSVEKGQPRLTASLTTWLKRVPIQPKALVPTKLKVLSLLSSVTAQAMGCCIRLPLWPVWSFHKTSLASSCKLLGQPKTLIPTTRYPWLRKPDGTADPLDQCWLWILFL